MKVESKLDRAVEDREGELLAREAVDVLIAQEVHAANLLERMTANHAFVCVGASSIVHFGGMLSLAKNQAIRLSAAGRAFRLMPELERMVLDKELPIDSVAALAMILAHPTLKKDAWAWLKRAVGSTPGPLVFAIRKAIAAAPGVIEAPDADCGPGNSDEEDLPIEYWLEFVRLTEASGDKGWTPDDPRDTHLRGGGVPGEDRGQPPVDYDERGFLGVSPDEVEDPSLVLHGPTCEEDFGSWDDIPPEQYDLPCEGLPQAGLDPAERPRGVHHARAMR